MHTTPLHPPVFLPKVTRIFGPLLLVDSRELREPATCFYWSTGREDDSDEGHTQDSVSGDRTCQILTVLFLLVDKEPISGSHISSFLHILPLKQYKAEFQ